MSAEVRTEYPSSVEISNDSKDMPHPSTKCYGEVGQELETAKKALEIDAYLRQQLGLPPRTPFGAA